MGKLKSAALWLVLFALGMLVVSWTVEGAVGGTTNIPWYISRAAGLSAYVLLWLNIALGLVIRDGASTGTLPRWRLYDLHQFTAPLGLGLLALHVSSLLWDSYVGFSLPQLVVPMLSAYRPIQVTLGILAMYLLLVITLSSYLEHRIGHRTWRILHYLSVPAYILSLYHAVLSGTDSRNPWAVALYLISFVILAYLANRRFRFTSDRRKQVVGRA